MHQEKDIFFIDLKFCEMMGIPNIFMEFQGKNIPSTYFPSNQWSRLPIFSVDIHTTRKYTQSLSRRKKKGFFVAAPILIITRLQPWEWKFNNHQQNCIVGITCTLYNTYIEYVLYLTFTAYIYINIIDCEAFAKTCQINPIPALRSISSRSELPKMSKF